MQNGIQSIIELKKKKKKLTRLASGSRQVWEFLESETALGETILGVLSVEEGAAAAAPRPEMSSEEILSPERWELAKERLRVAVLGPRLEEEWEKEEERVEEEEGSLRAPTAAMDAMLKLEQKLKTQASHFAWTPKILGERER